MNNKYENLAVELMEIVREKDMARAKEILQATPPADIVRVLVACEDRHMAVIFRLLDKDAARVVFELIDPPAQAALIESFTSQEAVGLLSDLDADDVVRLLDELPARVAKRLMEALPKEQRAEATRLMGYADGTVGRLISRAEIIVRQKSTARDAWEKLRTEGGNRGRTVTNVYVVDEQGVYVGAVPLSAVIAAAPDASMQQLVAGNESVTLSTGQDQEKAARLLKRMDALELPVLDSERHLVGVLTATDAMDIIQEEVTDDIYDKVGLLDLTKRESDRSFNLINGSFWHVFKVRVPFLLVTLAGGMLAGAVIDAFEEVLAAVVATAIFIPVIMDMGGNVGTQSSTIFTRGMVLGHINLVRFFKQWVRESLHGMGMGVILGAIARMH